MLFYGGEVAVVVQHGKGGDGQAECLPDEFATVFIHAERGGEHAAACVGDAERFERALHGAVFAVGAVQDVKGSLKTLGFEFGEIGFGGVKRMGINAFALQGGEDGFAAGEGDFAF